VDELLGEAELHRPETIRIIDRFTVIPASHRHSRIPPSFPHPTVIPASHRHSRKKAGIQINPVA
jgi:hypothetical protein